MVKKFLKEPQGIDLYDDVSVKYIPGHKPEMIVTDDSGARTTVDIMSTTNMHEFLRSLGFHTRT